MAIDYLKSKCDEELLRGYLAQELSADQEAELEAHLDQCPRCRERIRTSAAEEPWWAAAGNYLKRDDIDEAGGGVEPNQVILRQIREWLDPADDPRYLGRFGGYEILGVVGFGGMGVVLKGFEPALNRYVAIKVLSPALATSGASRQRFAREAQAAAAVLHENVISIHRVDQSHGLPYLVMPFVSGLSLQRRIDDEGPLPLAAVLRIGRQIAAGLAAAHAQGLVHRDIKPANILLDRGVERVTITDFGLARAADDGSLTKTGVIAGTPQYMSPEQSRGEAIDARSDLFSLGSVLYAMCTGRPPFRAETGYATLRRVTDDQPRPVREINPEIPQWLCQLIGKLMAKQAAERYQSAAEVAELLEACLAHVQQPTVAELPPALQPAAGGGRSFFPSRRWSGVLAMIAAFGVGLLGLFAWQATEAPDIAGNWSGEEWGQVVLKQTADGEYSGTYSDTFKERPGTIEVQWSRLERRYKGKWQEGQDRAGKISLRLVDDEIRGAWTTSKKSEINPGTPELADLKWKRSAAAPDDDVPGIRVHVLLSADTHSREVLGKNIGFDQLSIMGRGIKGTVNGELRDNIQAVMAHGCRLERFDETELLLPGSSTGEKCWRATLFVPQDSKSDGANLELSQKRLDGLLREGVQFWLDHLREAPAPTAQPAAEIQVKIAAPQKMEIALADQRGQFGKSPPYVAPARLNLVAGKIYRLKLTNIAGREGAEFFPTLGVGSTAPSTIEFLSHNAIPIEFTEEDFDQALAGNLVTKVIYLPDSEFQEAAPSGVETLVSTRLDPGKDPITEAGRRGSILAIIRLGNKDIELPGDENEPSATLPDDQQDVKQDADLHLQSLIVAVKQFNAETAEVRRDLFDPPIKDLTVERLRDGFRQTAEIYRRQDKKEIADVLQEVADSGRLPKDASALIATGVHARDEAGRTVSRQIVPGFTLPDGNDADRLELIVLRPLELIYRKDGPASKDYGDQFVPADAAADQASTLPKGMRFLAPYPQLHKRSLDMTEKEFLAIAESQKLKVSKSAADGKSTYSIPTGDGHTVIVMFSDDAEKCRGIQRLHGEADIPDKARPQPKADETRLWNAFGVTRAPVAPLSAKVLEWSGLHLNPITKGEFRDKNVLAKYSGGLDVSFVRSNGPAEKARIHEVDIVVGLQGQSLTTLQELDAAIKAAVEQVKRGDAEAFQWDVLRDGETIRINMPFPAGELALDDSDSHAALPKRLHRLITDEKVKLVACSPDGKVVAVATDQSTFPSPQIDWKRAALVLDADSRKMVKLQITTSEEYSQLAANKGTPRSEVTAIVFSHDGSQVAIGTSLGQVKLFDAQTGEEVAALDDENARPADDEILRKLTAVKRAQGSISSLAFSPDCSLLATCGGSFEDVPFDETEQGRLGPTGPGHVKVWEVKTGKLKHDLVGHSYAGAVAFSADGKLLASAGSWFGLQRGSGVIVWVPESGEKRRTIEQTTNGGVHSVAFGPEKTLLAFAALEFDQDSERKATKIILSHAGSGLTKWQQSIPRGAAVKGFSARGKSIAVLSSGRSIEFFDTETGQVNHEIKLADSPETLRWADLSIATKGNIMAIGGVGKDRQGSVEIWTVPAPERTQDSEAAKDVDSSSKPGD